jgi:YVTN family beta-propeller protein
MKLKWLALGGVGVITILIAGKLALQEYSSRELAPDQPGEEKELNQELWKFGKNSPYPQIEHQAQGNLAEATLPNGWKINPAGQQVEVGRLPYEAVNYAGKTVVLNTGWYGQDPQEVSIIDPNSGKIIKTLKFKSIFPSASEGKDGELYISGGFDQKIYRVNRDFNPVREYPVKGYTSGIAPINNHHLAVAYVVTESESKSYVKGKLALLNTDSGQVEKTVDAGYFPYAVRYLNNKVYVTLLGENKVLVYDASLNLIKTISVGKSPQEACSDGDKLYVVNTGSDNLSIIDIKKDTVIGTINVRHPEFRFGTSPTSCAIDGDRLYVTQAEINAVTVFDKNKKQLIGFIPTGWYPTKVLLNQNQMLVLSAKGIKRRRPNLQGPQPISEKGGNQYILSLLQGSLAIITKNAIASSLSSWSKQVQEGSPIYSPKEGIKLPIRHIFYIIKENRTYDQVLGDLDRGNGDKSLTLFGREITPNHHKLAEDFVTLDNFYANGEISVLGHSFTTSGYASPFLEWLGNMQYSGRYNGYPFGIVPVTFSPAYLWNVLEAKKVDYRIYGEPYYIFTRSYQIIVETYGADSELAKKFYAQSMVLAAHTDRGKALSKLFKSYYGKADTQEDAVHLLENPDFASLLSQVFTGDDSLAQALQTNSEFRSRFAAFLYHYSLNYHYYDLQYSDLQRFEDWKTDFQKQLKSGQVAQLNYIWLPNDHTAGSNPLFPNPNQLVAQNDAALGKIVQTISQSSIWKDSLILVVEDDAQNGPDHVDATRTVALAAGPYVKHNVVVSDRYDQLSLLRTIEVILGLDPINLNDGLAAPMFGIFNEKADPTPYLPPNPSTYLLDADKNRYEK